MNSKSQVVVSGWRSEDGISWTFTLVNLLTRRQTPIWEQVDVDISYRDSLRRAFQQTYDMGFEEAGGGMRNDLGRIDS